MLNTVSDDAKGIQFFSLTLLLFSANRGMEKLRQEVGLDKTRTHKRIQLIYNS